MQGHNVTSGSISIGLDGKSAQAEAASSDSLKSAQPSFDMLSDIRTKVNLPPCEVTFFRVEGHQQQRHGRQTYYGFLNDLCDGLAKGHMNRISPLCPMRPNQRFGDEGFSLRITGTSQKLAQLDIAKLYDYTYGSEHSIPHWQQCHGISPDAIAYVNWDAIANSIKFWPWGKRKWLTKFMLGVAPTGRVMKRRKEWDHDCCPVCLNPDETSLHVLGCSQSLPAFNAAVVLFADALRDVQTDPVIIEIMTSRLRSWARNSRPHPFQPACPKIRGALQSQDRTGWHNFLFGRLSNGWSDAQQQWIIMTSSRWQRSVSRWAARVVVLSVTETAFSVTGVGDVQPGVHRESLPHLQIKVQEKK